MHLLDTKDTVKRHIRMSHKNARRQQNAAAEMLTDILTKTKTDKRQFQIEEALQITII